MVAKKMNEMEKRIFKYELRSDGINISMPKGAEILTVQSQNRTLCLWALVDPEADKEIRYFEVFRTGHPVGYDMGVTRNYIATVQDGSFVWHVFEYTGV
jgi:hypothetical protein